MNSQEELLGCLWHLTDALAPNHTRRRSIGRAGATSRASPAQERHVGSTVEGEAGTEPSLLVDP
jgi:hypothetical protein